jgi:hypothetical protein
MRVGNGTLALLSPSKGSGDPTRAYVAYVEDFSQTAWSRRLAARLPLASEKGERMKVRGSSECALDPTLK